ncbi:MAG: hypothetical protein ABWY11_09120 [Umezawaea sp.]
MATTRFPGTSAPADDTELVIYEFDRAPGAGGVDFVAFSVHCHGPADLSAVSA